MPIPVGPKNPLNDSPVGPLLPVGPVIPVNHLGPSVTMALTGITELPGNADIMNYL